MALHSNWYFPISSFMAIAQVVNNERLVTAYSKRFHCLYKEAWVSEWAPTKVMALGKCRHIICQTSSTLRQVGDSPKMLLPLVKGGSLALIAIKSVQSWLQNGVCLWCVSVSKVCVQQPIASLPTIAMASNQIDCWTSLWRRQIETPLGSRFVVESPTDIKFWFIKKVCSLL